MGGFGIAVDSCHGSSQLELGHDDSWHSLCDVAAIDMALPSNQTKGGFWQSSDYVPIQCYTLA